MITVSNLSFTYPKATEPVQKNLSFQICQGEVFGFLGPSGAGKSTTQKILYKILNNFRGEVSVSGTPLRNWGTEYFERIGVGFELPNHYLKLTARENLQFFASFYRTRTLHDLDELFDAFGLGDSSEKKVEEYSKGMKMRLNFIRAIMHDPDVLFLDEPTSGLDPINAKKIKRYITKLKGDGKTIFVTTHDMFTADEICDRVSFINGGEIRATAKPSVLKHEHGRHVVIVELQDGRSAEFPTSGLGSNPEFLQFISRNEILRMNTQEATLEDVFIKITGSRLSE